ncbi:hypothetical protein PV325_005002 [Microctonus aethiopoides]|nr:hypothetical protein PV325_005002 [Microctonus aethiopoides]
MIMDENEDSSNKKRNMMKQTAVKSTKENLSKKTSITDNNQNARPKENEIIGVVKDNICLDIYSRIPKEEQIVWFGLMERKKSRKEVITDYDMSLKKFSEALCKESNIKSAEIMQKRVYSTESKNYLWKETSNIIITVEGSSRPNEIKLYWQP